MSITDRKKAIEAVSALCRLASLNFPGTTDVRLQVEGQHHGSIVLPYYVLLAILSLDSENSCLQKCE